MKRRGFMRGLAALAALPSTGALAQVLAPDHPLHAAWQAWKAASLMADGRVVDGFQNAASHSEGQGYGLTLAAMMGDAAAVDAIIGWTEANLAVRDDALLAWRWQPDALPRVADRNNASDGDLFYAWGLVLAGGPLRLDRAKSIVADLLRLCVIDGSDGPLLLPGVTGFALPGGAVINPSYYMPRALRELAPATGQARLAALADAGERLIEGLAASGPVPDWVSVTAAGVQPAPDRFSKVSGYEAIRVPLFALWSGRASSMAVQRFATAAASRADATGTPVVLDPPSGQVLERSLHPGYAAVAALADCAASGAVGSAMPAFSTDQPYYPATLHLMALVAQATTFPRCVPI